MGGNTWPKATKSNPCPRCGHERRCHHDGRAGRCYWPSEADFAGVYVQKEGEDDNGSFAVWYLDPPEAPVRRATSGEQARVYERLLALSPMPPDRVEQEARARRLTVRQVAGMTLGVLPATGPKRREMLKTLEREFGADVLAAVPGFKPARGGVAINADPSGGILIPVRDTAGDIISFRLRVAGPTEGGKYRSLSGGEGGTRAPIAAYVTGEPKGGLAIMVEGEFTAVHAAGEFGTMAIGVPGVSLYRTAGPALDEHKIGTVVIAYDSDQWETPEVAKALLSAVGFVRDSGREVRIATWWQGKPSSGTAKGIDDRETGEAVRVLTGSEVNRYLAELAAHHGFEAPQVEEDEWDEPEALEVWPAPAPPEGVMPPSLEQYTNAVTAQSQTPRDNAQAIALGILAAATQGQFCVQILGRQEVLSVAVAVGADSAERKSADLAEMRTQLDAHGAAARLEFAERNATNEAHIKLLQSREANILKRAAKDGESGLTGELADVMKALENVRNLYPRRLTCQDVTPERLAKVLQEQGSIALLSAEGGPLEDMAGKYANRREVANVYMQGFSNERITCDRQSGIGYAAESPSLTMMVMSQPPHLRKILTDPLYAGRGLLERFIWIFPDARAGYRKIREAKPVPPNIRLEYEATLNRLLPPTTPATGQTPVRTPLKITGDGEEAILQLMEWLEPQYRPEGELYHVRAWANRLPTLACKVSALWHLWECSAQRQTVALEVDSRWVLNAVRWIKEYIIPMGLRSWGMMGYNPAASVAGHLLTLLQGSPETTWTTREIQRRRQHLTGDQIQAAMNTLEEKGWIRIENSGKGKRGRPSKVIKLSPRALKKPSVTAAAAPSFDAAVSPSKRPPIREEWEDMQATFAEGDWP